jgi:hypothetical protein
VPGVAGLVAAILGTAVIAWAGHLAATVADAIAVVALACWLIIYARISAPVNSGLTAASQREETPADAGYLDSDGTASSPHVPGCRCWPSGHCAQRS